MNERLKEGTAAEVCDFRDNIIFLQLIFKSTRFSSGLQQPPVIHHTSGIRPCRAFEVILQTCPRRHVAQHATHDRTNSDSLNIIDLSTLVAGINGGRQVCMKPCRQFGNKLVTALAMSGRCQYNVNQRSQRRNWLTPHVVKHHRNVITMLPRRSFN